MKMNVCRRIICSPLAAILVLCLPLQSTQFDINGVTMKQIKLYEIDSETLKENEGIDSLENTGTDFNKSFSLLLNQGRSENFTSINSTYLANDTLKSVKCKERVYEEGEELEVEIVNGTHLAKLLQTKPDITSRDVEADCVLVLFYARACPFSAHAAPYFNALARAYPKIKMVALDALKYHGINAQYGIVGVPTLKMFHNGRPVAKFNGTEYKFVSFCEFLYTVTGELPLIASVTNKDFQGPVPSVVEKDTDYFLVLSWLFIVVCSIYYFMQSKWWKMIVEMVQNNWRESEAQHEHND